MLKYLQILFLIGFVKSGDVPADLKNLAINELNLYGVGVAQFMEITDGGRGSTLLDGVFIVFFDQYGNRYASATLTGIETGANGLLAIGKSYHADVWPAQLQLDSIAAVSVYYLEDAQIPLNVEVDHPLHHLLDGAIYRAPVSTPHALPSIMQYLMTGDPLVQGPSDGDCYYFGQPVPCDKALSKCAGQRNQADGYMWGPPTPNEPNQCPQPYFVLNEFRVNTQGGVKNEFVEIRTSDKNGTILKRSLDAVNLVGFVDDQFPVGVSDPNLNATFVLSLKGHSLNENGYFTIGDPNYPCPPETPKCIDLAWSSDDEFLPTGTNGLALLWGPIDFPNIRSGVQLHVIDSSMYSTDIGEYPDKMSDGLNLANQDILFINDSSTVNGTNVLSFARQDQFDISMDSEFSYAHPTPDDSNDGAYLAPAELFYTVHRQTLLHCRINEIGLTVSRQHAFEYYLAGGGDVTFDFVEVLGPVTNPPLSLDGMLAVVYSQFYEANTPNAFNSIAICMCNGTTLNDQGIGVCPCPKQKFNSTMAAAVVVALHLGSENEFVHISAADGAKLLHSDSVFFKTSTELSQPQWATLRALFAPNQQFDLTPPAAHFNKKQSFSYSRCFGIPEASANWLASFGLTLNTTEDETNQCPPPMLTISQFQISGTSMLVNVDASPRGGAEYAPGKDLSLSQAVLAAAQDDGSGVAKIVAVDTFGDAHIGDLKSGTLTCQNVYAGVSQYPFSFDVTKPAAVILYWDIAVPSIGATAPTGGILTSEVITAGWNDSSVPASLLKFSSTGHLLDVDETGFCALTHFCTGAQTASGWIDGVGINTTRCLSNACAYCCRGGVCPSTTTGTTTVSTTPAPTADNLNLTMYFNELFYDFETNYTYVEVMTTKWGALGGMLTYLYHFTLYNDSTSDGVRISFPLNINFVTLRKKLVTFSDDPNVWNMQTDCSQLKLVPNGPGAICIEYEFESTNHTSLASDCVVYTTDESNTKGLTELQARFDKTGYVVIPHSSSKNVSVSRCAPGRFETGIAFVNSEATINKTNECPQYPSDYTLAAKVDGTDCYTDGDRVSREVYTALVEKAHNKCSCLTDVSNVDFANKSRDLYSCSDDGNLQLQFTVWSVSIDDRDSFDKSMQALISSSWQSITIVEAEGNKTMQASYRSAYYQVKQYQPGVNILLIASIVVGVIAGVVSILTLGCLCWTTCSRKDDHIDGVIVPMQGRRVDKSAIDLHPISDGLNENIQIATIDTSSQAQLLSSTRRWTPPSTEYVNQALLITSTDDEPGTSQDAQLARL